MELLRVMVGRLVVVLVLGHTLSLSVATAALWPAVPQIGLVCTRMHGAHEVCPMHQGRPDAERQCAIGSATAVPTAALTTALDIGLISDGFTTFAEAASPRSASLPTSQLRSRPAPPDPPPPRT